MRHAPSRQRPSVAASVLTIALLLLAPSGTLAQDASPTPGMDMSDSWQQARSSDGSTLAFADIVATDEGFVALGWRQGSARRGEDVFAPTWRSADGATWHPGEPIPLPDGARTNQLVALGDELYAVGMDGTHLAVWRSTESGAWHRLKDRASFAANPPGTGRRFGADITDVVAGHGRIVVSGDYWTLVADPEVDPVVWSSTDGRRWRRSHETLPPPDNGIHDLAVTPSGFIGLVGTNAPTDCANGSERSLILRSTDGRSWERSTRRAFGCGASDVIFEPVSGRTYALGDAPDVDGISAVVLASDDLRTWSEVYRPPSEWEGQPWSPSAQGIESVGGTVVIVGDASWGGDRDGGTVWAAVSTDGETWQLSADWPQGDGMREELESWAVDGSRLVVDAGIGIWYTDLAEPDPAAATTSIAVPSAKQALECDFKGLGSDSGRGNWEGGSGYASPREALQSAIREGFVIPQAGYRALARNDSAVLYGYEHKGEVKVAVRVTAAPGDEEGWVPERLISCRLVEFGPRADMGRGVWLWANRWGRTVQERVGPGHCDWQSARFLYWAPPGTPGTLRATRLYVRDPMGVFRGHWTMPFLRSTSLPSSARYTGFRRDGKALWLAADERAMYVKDDDRVERWPRIPTGTGCA